MPHYICVTCGVQYDETEQPLQSCPICEDERQYVNWRGQQWSTLDQLRQDHHNIIRDIEPGLTGIGTCPTFAIGQRALLIETPHGNVLWDCISLLDKATRAVITALGGISAIAISHPHFYSSMVAWSQTFDAPIYLHAENRPYVMRSDPLIRYWQGDSLELLTGLTLIRCGGHFPGSTVLHWADGAGGEGALFTGDTLQVVQDRRYVSFMYSYPNFIPLSPAKVRRIVDAVEPYAFERIYGGWWQKNVTHEAKAAVKRSAERYLRMIQDD